MLKEEFDWLAVWHLLWALPHPGKVADDSLSEPALLLRSLRPRATGSQQSRASALPDLPSTDPEGANQAACCCLSEIELVRNSKERITRVK